MYEVGEEDGFLSVCAILFGLTARNVSVSVSTSDDRDAEGMITQVMLTTRGVITFLYFTVERDFEATTAQLTFSPIDSERCTAVSVVNDTILESDEEFTVELQTADQAVTLDPQSSVVIISDNDGMMYVTRITFPKRVSYFVMPPYLGKTAV